MTLNTDIQRNLISVKDAVVVNFNAENWLELGTITSCLDLIKGHDRLLRSLSWGDPDYSGNALAVLISMFERDQQNFQITKEYLAQRFPDGGENISSVETEGQKRIYFTPSVFEVPTDGVDKDLVAVMMPFSQSFDAVYDAIKDAAARCGVRTGRVDDLWEHSTVIQDIFKLIFKSFIVVCDFTGRNPNVFYEAGIAHTLGRHLIPITQSSGDIPFDIQHHRYLTYLNNAEGRSNLANRLSERLQYLLAHRG